MSNARQVELKPFSASLTLTGADTEYALEVSPGTRTLQIRMRNSAHTCRFSATKGVVAAGGGMPLLAQEVQTVGLENGATIAAGPLYFASATAGAVVEIFGLVEIPK